MIRRFIRIFGRRSSDRVKDLGCNFFRQNSYHVVELGLAGGNMADRKLCAVCANHTSATSGQKTGSFIETVAAVRTSSRTDAEGGGKSTLLSPRALSMAGSCLLLIV